MPAAIIPFITGAAGGVLGGAAFASLTVGATIAIQIGSMVVLGAISRKLTDRASKSGNPVSQQREQTVRSADAYENFVYGRALVGGLTVYENAISVYSNNSTPNNRRVQVVKWAGHRVNCLESFRIDDRTLDPAVSSISWNPITYVGSGQIWTGDFRGATPKNSTPVTRLRWYKGNQTSADNILDYFSDDWGSDAYGRERAYGIMEIDQVEGDIDTVYAQGFPINVAAVVLGKGVFDPRRWALNGDPQFMNPGSWWYDWDTPANVTASSQLSQISSVYGASTYSYATGVGGYTDRAIRVFNHIEFASELMPIPVYSGALQEFTLVLRARQTSGTSVNYFGMSFYTDAGSHISGGVSDATGWSLGTFHYVPAAAAAWPAVWSTFLFTVGSGLNGSIPSSARYMRLGALAIYSQSPGVVEIQEMRINWQAPNAQFVTAPGSWEYRKNPSLSGGDYLVNERFGFGRESRQAVNASRYALNGDPCFRRYNTTNITSYWWDGVNPLTSIGSLTTDIVDGFGRRALVLVASAGSPGDAGNRLWSDLFPVDPSGVYTASLRAKGTGNRVGYVNLEFFSQNSFSTALGEIALIPAALPFPATWSTFVFTVGSGVSTIPNSARWARFKIYNPFSYTSGGGATTQWFQELMVQPYSYIKRWIEPWEQIDWASVSSAASWCDNQVATPSGFQARFECNGAGHTGRSYRDNLRDILGSGNLRATYTMSGWRFFGGWQQPNIEINKADIVGEIEIRASAETGDRYNTVRAEFYDRHQDFKLLPAANVMGSEYVARDNSFQLYEDMQLPFTADWFEAQRVMFGVLDQGDNQQIAKIPLGWKGFGLQVGRQIGVRVDVLSWSPKCFMFTDAQYDPARGAVLATLREDFAASYTDVATYEYVPRSFGSVASAAPFVPQVGSVTVTPKPDAIALRWVNPANRAFEWVDIYRNTTNAFSGSTLAKSVRADEWTDNRNIGDNDYISYYWFQTRDVFSNVSSVYPGLTTSFYSSPLVQVANDPEYVFLDDFNYQTLDQLEARWERVSVPYPAGISFPQSGATIGGRVLAANSTQAWWSSKIRIPFDAKDLYQMIVGVTTVTSRDANDYMYAGFTAYRADGITPIQTNSDVGMGTQHYFVLNAFREGADLPASFGLWREFVGHARGTMPWPTSGTVVAAAYNHTADPSNAARMHDLTRYVSPMFLLNYNAGTGLSAIDYVKVRKITIGRTVTLDPFITAPSNWVSLPNVAPTSMAPYGGYIGASGCLFNNVAVRGEYNTITVYAQSYGGGSTGTVVERFNPALHRYFTDATSLRLFWEAKVYVENLVTNCFMNVGGFFAIYTKQGSLASINALTAYQAGGNPNGFPYNAWTTIGRSQILPNSLVNATSYPPPYYLTMGLYVSPWTSNTACAHVAYFRGDVLPP